MPRTLVVLGASYAADWGQPELPGYRIVNRGVGGQETHDMRARLQSDVLDIKPDVVLLWGHINNIHRAPAGGVDAARKRAVEDFQAMVTALRDARVKVIIGTEVPLSEAIGWKNRLAAFVGRLRGKQGYAAWVNDNVRAVNANLRQLATQTGSQLLDFERVFDDGAGFRKVEFTAADGTHISSIGYDALTRYTRQQLP